MDAHLAASSKAVQRPSNVVACFVKDKTTGNVRTREPIPVSEQEHEPRRQQMLPEAEKVEGGRRRQESWKGEIEGRGEVKDRDRRKGDRKQEEGGDKQKRDTIALSLSIVLSFFRSFVFPLFPSLPLGTRTRCARPSTLEKIRQSLCVRECVSRCRGGFSLCVAAGADKQNWGEARKAAINVSSRSSSGEKGRGAVRPAFQCFFFLPLPVWNLSWNRVLLYMLTLLPS